MLSYILLLLCVFPEDNQHWLIGGCKAGAGQGKKILGSLTPVERAHSGEKETSIRLKNIRCLSRFRRSRTYRFIDFSQFFVFKDTQAPYPLNSRITLFQ